MYVPLWTFPKKRPPPRGLPLAAGGVHRAPQSGGRLRLGEYNGGGAATPPGAARHLPGGRRLRRAGALAAGGRARSKGAAIVFS